MKYMSVKPPALYHPSIVVIIFIVPHIILIPSPSKAYTLAYTPNDQAFILHVYMSLPGVAGRLQTVGQMGTMRL